MNLTFGEGTDLQSWQMATRDVVVFVIALGLIRASGRWSFGQHSPSDACVTMLLGAVLSRAVVGASPFVSTVAAAAVIVFLHRAVALLSIRWRWFEDLVTGREIDLVHHGQIDWVAMRHALVTGRNLQEAVRQTLGDKAIADVQRAVLERGGKLTIIGEPPVDGPGQNVNINPSTGMTACGWPRAMMCLRPWTGRER